MKAGLPINMLDLKNYKKANLYTYQRLIEKLIYFSCSTKLDISLIIGQLSRHNIDLKKRNF